MSLGVLVAGRITPQVFAGQAIAKTLGGILAAGAIDVIATGSAGGHDSAANEVGQNSAAYQRAEPARYGRLSCV